MPKLISQLVGRKTAIACFVASTLCTALLIVQPTPRALSAADASGCASARALLTSIYSTIVGGTDRYTLGQNKDTAYCKGTDLLLSGAGTGPSCGTGGHPACGLKMNNGANGPAVNLTTWGWSTNLGMIGPGTIDTVREETLCAPATFTTPYFSTYTRTEGSIDDQRTLNQQHSMAYCDPGDLAIAGGGSTVYCSGEGDPNCNGNQMLEGNNRFINGDREGWLVYLSLMGDAYLDTIQTNVVCLKKTALFDQYLRIYHIVNSTGDFYGLNQNRSRAFCIPGDIAIAGGGNPPFCDGANPACGKTEYLESNKKITSGGKQGWELIYNLDQNATPDTQRTEVTCLGLVTSCPAASSSSSRHSSSSSSKTAKKAVCGNNKYEKGEKCDLGKKNETGKGCTKTCTLQSGWRCVNMLGLQSICMKKPRI